MAYFIIIKISIALKLHISHKNNSPNIASDISYGRQNFLVGLWKNANLIFDQGTRIKIRWSSVYTNCFIKLNTYSV